MNNTSTKLPFQRFSGHCRRWDGKRIRIRGSESLVIVSHSNDRSYTHKVSWMWQSNGSWTRTKIIDMLRWTHSGRRAQEVLGNREMLREKCSSQNNTSFSYPIPKGSPENLHASSIIQTDQIVLLYLETHIHTHTHLYAHICM